MKTKEKDFLKHINLEFENTSREGLKLENKQ